MLTFVLVMIICLLIIIIIILHGRLEEEKARAIHFEEELNEYNSPIKKS